MYRAIISSVSHLLLQMRYRLSNFGQAFEISKVTILDIEKLKNKIRKLRASIVSMYLY